MKAQIKSVRAVTAQGPGCLYEVGTEIVRIQINTLHVQGDPYDHYCGYSANDEMLFSINCLVPCEVTYAPSSK